MKKEDNDRFTQSQRSVFVRGGIPEEKRAQEWLEERSFEITESFDRKHPQHWDIKAVRDGERWVFEVKSDYGAGKPPVNISSLLYMVRMPDVDKIGLIFMSRDKDAIPLLFELSKMSYAALKAWKTRRQ